MLVLLILVFPMHRASGNEASTGTLTSVCHLTSSYQVPSKDNGSYVWLGMAGLIITMAIYPKKYDNEGMITLQKGTVGFRNYDGYTCESLFHLHNFE